MSSGIPMWWSLVLAVIGAAGVYLTGRKLWTGFAVGLGVQVLWIAYAVATSQYGFFISAGLFGWMNYLGLRRWLNDKKREREATDAKTRPTP